MDGVYSSSPGLKDRPCRIFRFFARRRVMSFCYFSYVNIINSGESRNSRTKKLLTICNLNFNKTLTVPILPRPPICLYLHI